MVTLILSGRRLEDSPFDHMQTIDEILELMQKQGLPEPAMSARAKSSSSSQGDELNDYSDSIGEKTRRRVHQKMYIKYARQPR